MKIFASRWRLHIYVYNGFTAPSDWLQAVEMAQSRLLLLWCYVGVIFAWFSMKWGVGGQSVCTHCLVTLTTLFRHNTCSTCWVFWPRLKTCSQKTQILQLESPKNVKRKGTNSGLLTPLMKFYLRVLRTMKIKLFPGNTNWKASKKLWLINGNITLLWHVR